MLGIGNQNVDRLENQKSQYLKNIYSTLIIYFLISTVSSTTAAKRKRGETRMTYQGNVHVFGKALALKLGKANDRSRNDV